MRKIIVSAPGKLMLLGEHAVLYNKPCIVTAVDKRMNLTLEVLNFPEFQLNAPDVKIINYKKQINEIGKGYIPKGAKFVELAIKNILDVIARSPAQWDEEAISFNNGIAARSAGRRIARNDKNIGLKIITKSEFSSQYGFGSSSASTVCTIKALSELLKLRLSPKEIFDLSYRTILDVQGSGSGFDAAAAVYGGIIYFTTAGKPIEPLQTNSMPLLVAYSGIKADTVKLINQVKEKFTEEPLVAENIYNEVEQIVEKAKNAILTQNWEELGSLMNKNQKLLVSLGVSTEKFDNMIGAAVKAGAYGAKLSGAGGGDCIIALAPEKKRKAVENAIKQARGEIISVKANAVGIRIEL